MKKLLFFAIILILSQNMAFANGIEAALNRAAEQTLRDVPQRTRIAIVFITAPDRSTSDFIAGELEFIWFNSGHILTDRRQLDVLRQEQNFHMSGEVDDATAVSIGRFVGADIIVTGGLYGEGDLQRLRLRAIDVETAQVVGVASERLDQSFQHEFARNNQTQAVISLPVGINVEPFQLRGSVLHRLYRLYFNGERMRRGFREPSVQNAMMQFPDTWQLYNSARRKRILSWPWSIIGGLAMGFGTWAFMDHMPLSYSVGVPLLIGGGVAAGIGIYLDFSASRDLRSAMQLYNNHFSALGTVNRR